MSRIGKKPIAVPSGVKVEIRAGTVSVSGTKGQLQWTFPGAVSVALNDNVVTVDRANDDKKSRELHGLSRALIANMIKGVVQGYEKRLLIFGTGYSCKVNGKNLELSLGFMGRSINKGPQFTVPIPEGIEVVIEVAAARGESNPAKLLIKGFDKQKVGKFAAEVRSLRKPEPYKGKGVRYEDEHVRRKQGKALAGAGG